VFLENWLTKHDWLEYSVAKDATFCFYCFVFKQKPLETHFTHDAFSKEGYRNWKNAYNGFPLHVGGPTSYHNRARTAYADFRNRRASISHKIGAYSVDVEKKYETRVTDSLDVASFLIAQAHPFRGHDESPSSLNRGNFLEMIESPSLVLVINDTKLLMPCVKCFELGISNTYDECVCGKEWWPQDHKKMVHGHDMMIMVEMHIKGKT
jgi:hypothetical protein